MHSAERLPREFRMDLVYEKRSVAPAPRKPDTLDPVRPPRNHTFAQPSLSLSGRHGGKFSSPLQELGPEDLHRRFRLASQALAPEEDGLDLGVSDRARRLQHSRSHFFNHPVMDANSQPARELQHEAAP